MQIFWPVGKRSELPGAEEESCIASQPCAISAISPLQPVATVADWARDGNGGKAHCLYTQFGSSLEERIGEGVREREMRVWWVALPAGVSASQRRCAASQLIET